MIATWLAARFNGLIAILGALGGLVLAIIAVYYGGKRSGKDSATAVHEKQETERTEAVLDEIRKQQEAIQGGASLSRDDIDNLLRDGKA